MPTQTLVGTGLASGFAAGSGDLAQGLIGTGLASGFAAGAGLVVGGPTRITGTGLETGFRAGVAALTGTAVAGVKIFIGGVDVTKYISLEGVNNPGLNATTSMQPLLITSQTLGRWTAVFDYLDLALATYPEIDQTFSVAENGVTIMSGGVISVQVDRWETPTGKAMQCYHVTCQDWSAICDRRVVNATYQAGTDVAFAVNDIWKNVLLNPNEGITANSVPATISTLDQTEVFAFVTVTQAFDQLATDTGCIWWVDVNADLHFVPYASLPTCPFSLTESSTNWRALSASATLVDYRNVQYVMSNLAAVPGVAHQTPGTPGYGGPVVTETYTLPQAAAAARGFLLGSLITNFPIASIVSLTVNGVAQPIQLFTAPYNLEKSYWFFPGFPFLYPPSTTNNSPSFPYPPVTSPYPSGGDVLVISYVAIGASQSASVVRGSPLVPATPGPGTWGSGTFENVQQVKNINLQSDLNAIAAALLLRSGTVPIQIQFETDEPGAVVGQKISINIPISFLPGATQWTITQIQMTLQTGVLEFGSRFRSVIIATSGQDLGNSTKWFERLIARTENPLPVQQFGEWIQELASGGTITGGGSEVYPAAEYADGSALFFTNLSSLTVDICIPAPAYQVVGAPAIVVSSPGIVSQIKITINVNTSNFPGAPTAPTVANFLTAWNASPASSLVSLAPEPLVHPAPAGSTSFIDGYGAVFTGLFADLSAASFAGSTVVAGTQLVSPKPLASAGTLVSAYAIAAIPPSGQNLVLDVLKNGVSIFGPGNQLVIPANDLDQVTTTTFAAPALTVAIGDILTVVASYQVLVTDGSQIAAANVTVGVRWSTPGLPAGQTQPGVYETFVG